MKFGSFFTLKESNRQHESDEREASISYNKEEDDRNTETLWVIKIS